MPRPIALKSGVFHLNVRVPADLAGKLRRSRVSLPLAGDFVTVVATDKVALSLRTKDPSLAKERFTEAFAALSLHFANVRVGPQRLTHKQAVALAGDVYRSKATQLESDPDLTPDWAAEQLRRLNLDVAEWQFGSGAEGDDQEVPYATACWLAKLARPSGPQLLAWELQADLDVDDARCTLDEALEHLFGSKADEVCAGKRILVDAESRKLLLREIGKAVHDAGAKLGRNLEGNFAPDPAAARYPAYEGVATTRDEKTSGLVETMQRLFERFSTHHADKLTPATLRRYGPSVKSLNAWLNGRDWRSLTDDDIFAWATYRCEKDGLAAATVNRNDLVAVSSILAWTTTHSGGKKATKNPALKVRLDVPKRRVTREKAFRGDEISAILKLARQVTFDPRYPRASASRRWCPWICAYTGARVQEPLWLQKEHVRYEDGAWIFDFQQTKTWIARRVPIHAALIEEGLLDFVQSAPPGYLFVGDRKQKPGSTRTAQELRAAELASWIQSNVDLKDVSPNHGWRHTWCTLAEAAFIPKRFSNRITGHNAEDVSDRYVSGLIPQLAIEMAKFPRYEL